MVEITPPEKPIHGEVKLPGSKSLSNRHLILNYLSANKGILNNLSTSEDTRYLIKALDQLKKSNNVTIDVGHAGTDFRFLTALLAFTPGNFILTGSKRLQERPIKELVNTLTQLGADVQYLSSEGYPPLQIRGKNLKGGSVTIDSSKSSQYISALFLASPLLDGPLLINLTGQLVSRPYLEMTIAVLKHYELEVIVKGNSYEINGTLRPSKKPVEIEGDWSAASYYYSICALSPGCRITLRDLSDSSLQGDAVLSEIYSSFGVKTTFLKNAVLLENIGGDQAGFSYDFTDCPDLAQTVAVTCAAQSRKANLRGLATLKIKETDRISALAIELRKLGCIVKEGPADLSIESGSVINKQTTVIDTYNDHRMAMSFAPFSLVSNKLFIKDPEVVAKSYPQFWEDLRSLGFNVNLQPR